MEKAKRNGKDQKKWKRLKEMEKAKRNGKSQKKWKRPKEMKKAKRQKKWKSLATGTVP